VKKMILFLARRVAIGIAVLLVASVLTFVLVALTPGNAAQSILGSTATPAAVAQLMKELHLDQPLPLQYWSWLKGALHGDFGTSLTTGEPVTQMMASRWQPTLSLVLLSTLVSVVSGIFFGVVSALRGGWVARAVDIGGLVAFAIPGFLVGVILIYAFALKLRLLPLNGYAPLDAGPGPWLRTLILPVIALSFGMVGFIAKQVRQSMTDVMHSEFIFTYVANGFPRRSVTYKHALRNAIVPATSYIGVQLVSVVGATVLIETVFAFPGVGSLAVSAATQHDLPVAQAAVLFFTAYVIVVNLLMDMLYVVLNPKIRMASS
jgi:peptide/nickel transport system permease protein